MTEDRLEVLDNDSWIGYPGKELVKGKTLEQRLSLSPHLPFRNDDEV